MRQLQPAAALVTPNGTGAQIGVNCQDAAMKQPGSYWKWEN
jgi:hypothetical protein